MTAGAEQHPAATSPRPEVRRTDVRLLPDPRRVVARLFLPGQESTTPGTSRAAGVVERCLALSDAETSDLLAAVMAGHDVRHRGFADVLESHFAAVAHRVEHAERLPAERRQLIGAYFTQEFSLEAAALFNPSVVAHPEQDVPPGQLRFVLSARAVGEGHLSSIVFRSGVLAPADADGPRVTMDPPSLHASAGTRRTTTIRADRLRHEAGLAGADAESLEFVLSVLPEQFPASALEHALETLSDQQLTRVHALETARCLRSLVESWYEIEFAPEIGLAERTLLPQIPVESRGVEDARFVRFTDDDGDVTYLATYTAYDGEAIGVRRLRTDDFRTFRSSTFTGTASTNKGMALFPRRVGGAYLALSRWDRENTAIASSADGHHWPDAAIVQTPAEPWELIQLGNCGSPIETPAGWLVLTHGVGPVRRYAIGALLLDLEDPTRVVGRLHRPLLSPDADERDGYVPNVVYSCGALLHDRTLLLPYGCSDSRIGIALVDLPALLDRLLHPSGHPDDDEGTPP